MTPPVPAPEAGAPLPLLDAELCAFAAGGVSIGVATRDAALRPHAARAVGLRCDGPALRLLVPRGQARDLLDDVAANGCVAVVLSQPSTHRTVQLKGRNARLDAPDDEDLRRVDTYREAFDAELSRVGFPRPYGAALLDGGDEPLVAIVFVPDRAFVATPGPNAGEPLGAPR